MTFHGMELADIAAYPPPCGSPLPHPAVLRE